MTHRDDTLHPAPARRSRQAQQATQDRIKEWILEEGLQTGDPLPTESELVELLGIGRNSVREALKALQALSIIEIRHGFGTYVGTSSLDAFTDALVFRGRKSLRGDGRDVREIVEVRQALEVGLIGQLIGAVDDAAVERLRERLGDLERDAEHDDARASADRAFHEQLFAPLGNRLMMQLLRVFWDVYRDLAVELDSADLDFVCIVEDHRAIYEAVAARDAEAATKAMADHFRGIRERLNP